MRYITKFFALIILLIPFACRKGNDMLPPETSTGAGTFGCKVNGKVWVPGGSNFATGQNTSVVYQHIYPGISGYVFVISSYNYDDDPRTHFSIGFDSIKALVGIPIILTNGEKGYGGAGYSIGSTKFTTGNNLKGELLFKYFDENNLIASGTFWFDAKNEVGDTINITEGRFDLKFTR